ncbi:hypothetical protein B0H17DRAFT_1065292 [Mycena rosella]|uniref:Uncharacterized protein n=1 Tax=Mycena rosella TaxID=1033263 RepID=A0AAD7DIB6_MYCRO|nr:hypothetical protein B0H17DRAFT_1065292 [Mycena rosella]
MAYTLPASLIANGSHVWHHRRFRLWILAGMVLVLLASFGFARRQLVQPNLAPSRPQLLAPTPAPAPPRIYLRAGNVGLEGLGSTLQHFKHSIVFSNALQSSLLLASNDGYALRPYSTSEIYNGQRNFSLDAYKACRIQAYVPHSDRERLVKGLCEGEAWALERMDQVRTDMEECTSILDTEDSEVREHLPFRTLRFNEVGFFGKTTNDLNGCVMGWVRERLAPTSFRPSPTAPLTRPITVGVHIRWGDTAAAPGEDMATHGFYGSWGLPNIVRVLADLRAYAHPHGISLTIAMQNADPTVLEFLNEPVYTLLDSDDAFADLRALSQNDVLLLGESSYGVLTHLIAPPGLTLVEGGGFHKFTNTSGFGRHVVFLDEYTPESLQLVVLPVDL